MNQEYSEYLLSDAWKYKRREKLIHGGKKCEICGVKKRLQIHHLTYERIFKEEMEDLMILCRRHHELVEDLYKRGILVKVGHPSHLRSQTVSAVRSEGIEVEAKEAPLKAMIGDSSEPRKERIFRLLQNQEFAGLLRLPRKEAKRAIKSMSHRCGNMQCTAYGQMLMTYDAFHGLNGYSTFRKEVLEAVDKIGITTPFQNSVGVEKLKQKIYNEKEFNARIKSLCSRVNSYSSTRKVKAAIEVTETLLQELQSFHRRIQIECGMIPTEYAMTEKPVRVYK